MKSDSRVRGFTLIELMITVVVLAVLAVLAAPSFSEFINKYRVRGAADALVSAVAEARAAAVKGSRDVTIAVNGSGAAWCMGARGAPTPASGMPFGASTDCDCSNAPSACMVDTQQLVLLGGDFQGVTLAAGSNSAPVAIDGKLGLQVPAGITSIPGDVDLATLVSPDGNFSLVVRLSPLGQASACVPATSTKPIVGYASC